MRERDSRGGAWRRALVLLLVAMGAASPAARAALTSDEENTTAIFRRLAPGVVYVTTVFAHEGPAAPAVRRGVGSGFVVSGEGHVLTNAHVVEGSDDILVTIAGQERRKARLVGLDAATDVAVLKIENPPPDLTVIPLGSSSHLQIGQKVLAIGNPFGLSQTLTVGVVSGLDRMLPTTRETVAVNVIQTDAAINVGNSGGPLLSSNGEAVGVNTALIQGAQSIAFAIPIDTVKAVLPQLLREGRVIR
ncbi:MAG: S1C family serine protease, partial [Candidatus Methylomirabilales bacterium]